MFLGTPIGCRDWVEQQLDREWRSSDRLREAVLDAELSAAVGWHTLNKVLGSRHDFQYRTVLPQLTAPLSQRMDSYHTRYLRTHLKLTEREAAEGMVLARARLPMAQGLGLRGHESLPYEGWVGGLAQAAEHLVQLPALWGAAVRRSSWLREGIMGVTSARVITELRRAGSRN